jgi:hypothetical protein
MENWDLNIFLYGFCRFYNNEDKYYEEKAMASLGFSQAISSGSFRVRHCLSSEVDTLEIFQDLK